MAKNNKGRIAETNRQWIAKNPERRRTAYLKWQRQNKEKLKEQAARRRALRANAEGVHTAEEIRAVYYIQHGNCFHCGVSLSNGYHEDHWIPLSRGGSNFIENIRLLCASCNLSKGSKLPWEWDDRYKGNNNG